MNYDDPFITFINRNNIQCQVQGWKKKTTPREGKRQRED